MGHDGVFYMCMSYIFHATLLLNLYISHTTLLYASIETSMFPTILCLFV